LSDFQNTKGKTRQEEGKTSSFIYIKIKGDTNTLLLNKMEC